MKNSNFNLILGALFFATMLFLGSCTKDQEIISSTEQPQLPKIEEPTPGIASGITQQNGLLNFQTMEDFRNTVLALNQMSPQDQLDWEKSLNFNSMQQIFNDIILAEYETVGAHSALYNENLQAGLILKNENNGLYDLNLFNPAYATVLNENGMVIVDNAIYQFTGSALKIWENGDVSQLQILEHATTSTANIDVVPMNFQEATLRNVPTWSDECESGNDSGMIRLSAFYNSDFLKEGTAEVIFIEYFVNVLSMVKAPGDEWEFDPNAEILLKGGSHVRLTVSNGLNQFTRNLVRTYNPILGHGGNFTFIPNVAGNYYFGGFLHFVNPAHLISADWYAENRLSDGSAYSCGIAF